MNLRPSANHRQFSQKQVREDFTVEKNLLETNSAINESCMQNIELLEAPELYDVAMSQPCSHRVPLLNAAMEAICWMECAIELSHNNIYFKLPICEDTGNGGSSLSDESSTFPTTVLTDFCWCTSWCFEFWSFSAQCCPLLRTSSIVNSNAGGNKSCTQVAI